MHLDQTIKRYERMRGAVESERLKLVEMEWRLMGAKVGEIQEHIPQSQDQMRSTFETRTASVELLTRLTRAHRQGGQGQNGVWAARLALPATALSSTVQGEIMPTVRRDICGYSVTNTHTDSRFVIKIVTSWSCSGPRRCCMNGFQVRESMTSILSSCSLTITCH